MNKVFILFTLLLLSACTTAGPFVTNISQNKDGTLTLEKCQVEHNAFTGAIATINCTHTKV